MSNDTSNSIDGMIIIDEVTSNPVLDFEAYGNTLVKMIKQSPPRFSIGIYGEWGTGKTTLMKTIQSKLNNHDDGIPTVWFNAWRYEGENISATVPLLLTIMNALEKQLEKEESKVKRENTSMHEKITDKLSKMKRYRNMFSGSLQVGIPGIISGTLNVTPENIDEHKKGSDQMEKQKPTIQAGVELIEEVKGEIKSSTPNNLKLVVFIDDLDRCSPKKALEVFESVKVFLDLDGLVYVIGLSHVTISNIITTEYKEIGIKGEHYIKKIIQVPVMLPEWNVRDVGILLDDLLKQNLIGEKYRNIIKNNSELVCEIVENNPRELKRFITTYVVASEIHQSYNQKIDPKQLLLIQALNVRWNRFYQVFVRCPKEVRNEIFKYVEMGSDQRKRILKTLQEFSTQSTHSNMESEKIEVSYPLQAKLIFQNFSQDDELWTFLERYKADLSRVQNWEVYRRAAGSEREVYQRALETARELPTPTDLEKISIALDNMRESSSKFSAILSTIANLMENNPTLSTEIHAFTKRLEVTLTNLKRTPSHVMFTHINDVIQTREDARKIVRLIRSNMNLDEEGIEELAFREFVTLINHLITGLTIQMYSKQ
jgi:hypothetical protein